jgi:hypothetical protein
MGDILDNFFSIIPVVLFVLWVLRRFSTARKKAEKEAAKKPVKNPGGASPGKPAAGLMEQFRALEERLSAAATDGKTPAASPYPEEFRPESVRTNPEKVNAVREEPWPGSPAAAAEPVPATAPPVVSIPKNSVPVPKTPRRAGESVSAGLPVTAAPGALERLDRLPPLARGFYWSIILEPPPSLRDPGN